MRQKLAIALIFYLVGAGNALAGEDQAILQTIQDCGPCRVEESFDVKDKLAHLMNRLIAKGVASDPADIIFILESIDDKDSQLKTYLAMLYLTTKRDSSQFFDRGVKMLRSDMRKQYGRDLG